MQEPAKRDAGIEKMTPPEKNTPKSKTEEPKSKPKEPPRSGIPGMGNEQEQGVGH
jgi:hypothetical protein